MADNTELNSGTGGDTIATDEIAGIKHQRVKVQYGDDGSATDVSDTNPLPIDDAGGSLTVDNAGTFAVQADSVIPGVGATNLGKAEDAVHSSGDVGVMVLGVRNDTLAALAADGDYAPLQVDAEGALYIHDPDKVSTNNSTAIPLAGDATFTGTGDDISQYASVVITIDASHDSATDGMTFQLSTDNSNWDDVYSFTYVATDGARRFQFPATAQYFRFVYTNGSTLQTHFRVQAIIKHHFTGTSIHRLVDNVDPDRSAEVVKSAILAQAAGSGDFVPVQSTAAGNFKIAIEEYESVPSGGGTEAGSLRVTLPTDGTGLLSVDDNGGSLTVDNGGTFAVQNNAATPSGTNLIGDVGISVRTSGGTTLYKNIDVDESEDEIKGTAGQVYWIHAMNLSASVLFLKLYNATAANVTVGTTTPDLTFPIPTQGDTNGAGFVLSIPNGIAFGTAITVAATTGVADNDSGAPGANTVVLNMGYA